MAVGDFTGSSIDLGGAASAVIFWVALIAIMVVFVAVMVFGVLWLVRLMRYKVTVDIYEHIGQGSHIGKKDVAKEAEELVDGKRKRFLRLLKSRKSIGPFGSQNFLMFGNRKKIVLHFENGIYTPLPIVHSSDASFKFKTSDLLIALQSWDQDYAENLETHKSKTAGFMEKYGMYVLPFSMILIMFVLFFILIQQMQSGVSVTATLDTSQLIAKG